MKKLRVAILGGSFNPPTAAHMEMGRKVLVEKKADKLMYVPCGARSDKRELLDGQHRLNMLNIDVASRFKVTPKIIRSEHLDAFKVPNKILIDDYEIRVYKRLMPTALLIQRYEREFPHIQFKFVMGSDLLESIKEWEFYDEILRHKEYLIFERDTHQIKDFDLPLNSEVLLEPNLRFISSTRVRKMLKDHYDSLSAEAHSPNLLTYLNHEVLTYIKQNRLYASYTAV